MLVCVCMCPLGRAGDDVAEGDCGQSQQSLNAQDLELYSAGNKEKSLGALV